MAICTLSQCLQYPGLSDTSASEPAIIVQAVTPSGSSTVSQVTLSKTTTVLTVTPTVTAGPSITAATFTLTSASYDTLSELVTGLNALPYLNAQLACGDGTVPSTLIEDDTTPIAANTLHTITYVNPTTDGTTGLITTVIPMVQAEFENYTGRIVDADDLDERYDGRNAEAIILKSAPVNSIASVSVFDDDGNETTIASTDYRLDSDAGVLFALATIDGDGFGSVGGLGDAPARNRLPAYRWPYGRRNVRVQYNAGWSTVPSDLNLAAIRRVCDLVLDRGESRLFATSAMQGRSMTRADEGKTVQDYFGKWRRFW